MMDDCGRIGEQNTMKDIMSILQQHDIKFSFGNYQGAGVKDVWVIASEEWKWMTSL